MATCKRTRILWAYNQFVPSSFWFFFRNHSFVLVIACILVFRLISIDTFDKRDQFSSKNTAVGLFKKQFSVRLRHFRSNWDLRIRAFDEAHPIVPFNFLGIFHIFFKNNYLKRNYNFCTPPVDAPCRELFIRISKFVVHSPLGLTANWFFVCPHKVFTPAVPKNNFLLKIVETLQIVNTMSTKNAVIFSGVW